MAPFFSDELSVMVSLADTATSRIGLAVPLMVWRGWYDVSWRYDTSWCLLWVSPMDIAASSKTKRVASFSNK